MSATARRVMPSILAIALAVSISAGVSARQRIDFSGTWISTSPSGRGEVKEVIIVAQDKTGMTATFTAEGQKGGEVIRYEFGAARTQKGGRDGEVAATVNTSWKGDTLVAANTIKVRDRVRSFEQVWSRDTAGQLVIKVTREGTPEPKTTVYRRQPPM